MIQIRLGRRLAMLLAALLLCLTAALTAHAADDALAPHAEPGDMDYIRDYIVTVDLREDGSADITYDIDWQVIAGDKTDYLTWVKIGLANAHVDSLTPLTDTIADLQYSDDGGSYAQVVFARRYYSPEVAAENGGESSVRFAFSVHQSHLFTLNDDGTANFTFTPGWFDDLSVGNMQIRWRNGEGFLADNTRVEGDYLVWDFGALAHGQAARAHVTVPVTYSAAFAPDAAMAPEDYGAESEPGDLPDALGPFFVFLVFAIAVFAIAASRTPRWGGGLGGGIDPGDWFWYTNGLHTIRRARGMPPPVGYRRTDPPRNFQPGGGSSRGGGVGRRDGGDHHSSCACACASSCACACACAGGGRAGCTAKDFYTVKLTSGAAGEEAPHES